MITDLMKQLNELERSYSGEEKRNNPRRCALPNTDVYEEDNSIILEMELPGVAKEDLKINVDDDNILSIKGNKKHPFGENSSILKRERNYGEFSRCMMLPEDADEENIKANFKDGILHLEIPKKAPVKPKEIEVEIS